MDMLFVMLPTQDGYSVQINSLNGFTVNVGEELELSAMLKDASDELVDPIDFEVTRWTSSPKTVATIDNNGKLTAKKEGKATVTVTITYYDSNDDEKTITGTKEILITDESGDDPQPSESEYTAEILGKTTVNVGDEENYTAVLKKDGVETDTITDVTWESSKASVATISASTSGFGGNLVAKAVGKSTITATISYGSDEEATQTIEAKLEIEVKDEGGSEVDDPSEGNTVQIPYTFKNYDDEEEKVTLEISGSNIVRCVNVDNSYINMYMTTISYDITVNDTQNKYEYVIDEDNSDDDEIVFNVMKDSEDVYRLYIWVEGGYYITSINESSASDNVLSDWRESSFSSISLYIDESNISDVDDVDLRNWTVECTDGYTAKIVCDDDFDFNEVVLDSTIISQIDGKFKLIIYDGETVKEEYSIWTYSSNE